MTHLETDGFCPTCDRDSRFVAEHDWLRDHYVCVRCRSIPRERALMHVLATRFPRWRELVIHESSPIDRGASARLRRECPGYLPSQHWPGATPGETVSGVRCENLECLTFADESIHLHVTQDVVEHILDPDRAFAEIGRTLRPRGAHVFTVPLVRGASPSRRRAERGADGAIVHLEPPEWHGNPISAEGSLVTFDWGTDIVDRVARASGLVTEIVTLAELRLGIAGAYADVLVSRKPGASPSLQR